MYYIHNQRGLNGQFYFDAKSYDCIHAVYALLFNKYKLRKGVNELIPLVASLETFHSEASSPLILHQSRHSEKKN